MTGFIARYGKSKSHAWEPDDDDPEFVLYTSICFTHVQVWLPPFSEISTIECKRCQSILAKQAKEKP